MKENFPQNSETIVSRHSIKGGGSEYEQLSPEGVEKARERAQEFIKIIEQAEPGSVIFFGGSSHEKRTESTLEVYVDEVRERLKNESNVLFWEEEKIADEAAKDGYLATAHEIQEKANENPEAKVVIDLPLVLKDFEKTEWLYEKDGSVKANWQALFDKYGKDYSAMIREWFENQGIFDGEQKIPAPAEIAESYLKGIKRLEDFVKKFSGERKIKIVIAGHSFYIDALLTYIANNGKVDVEGFKKIGDEVVDTAELSVIKPDEEGRLHLSYRGQDFVLEEVDGQK